MSDEPATANPPSQTVGESARPTPLPPGLVIIDASYEPLPVEVRNPFGEPPDHRDDPL